MSWFGRLFGGDKPPPRLPGVESPIIVAMRAEAQPCVSLEPSAEPTGCFCGGAPDAALSQPWPQWQGDPLAFLAQIDLAAVTAAGGPDWLPADGVLLFFYGPDERWGFDPADRGAWVVMLGQPGTAPTMPPVYPLRHLQPVAAQSYPQPDRLRQQFEAEHDNSWENAWAFADPAEPAHKIGGYPDPVQGDEMELECQLASNGVDVGSPEGYASDAAKRLESGRADWRLLLQIDSDDAVMWGDVGKLYFWIREQDARAGDFSAAWLVLQCH